MKIAHLTTVDLSLRHLLWTQIADAMAAGHELIGISAAGPDVEWLEARGLRHIELEGSTRSMSISGDLRAARHLASILRHERPEVLHTHNPKPGVYGRIVGRLVGVPLVVNTVHGLYATPDDRLTKRAVVYGLEAVASRFSHVELVQNVEDAELMGRLRLAPKRKITVLGNGVDLDRFRPGLLDEPARVSLRDELGLRPTDRVVGTVGRLVAEKGYPELFEAIGRLGDDDVRLLVVGGDDPEKADALSRHLIERAERSGRVVFAGHRNDVDRLFQVMDLFVLASHREGFPRAAMEAAASGLGIVATDIRGCRQVVADGLTGTLVPVRDPAALAEAIETWIGLPPDAAIVREHAEAHFDARAVSRIVLQAYEMPDRSPTSWGRGRGRGIRGRRSGTHPAVRSRAKRALDVTVAGVALVVLSPVLAAVALAVRWRLGSPVLFRQQRPGLHGEPFTIVKFRTMRDALDAAGEPLPDRERLTSFGRLLRSTSTDELPELVNVLRGEMSLVGPRPLLMEYLDQYTADERRRHLVRPGITGLAQVRDRNVTTFEQRFATDLEYVDGWSLALDLRLLGQTLRRVVTRSGVNQADHDTMPKMSR